MSAPLWQTLVVSGALFLGVGAVLCWASIPHIYRSYQELAGRRTHTRSSLVSWLYLVYGSILLLVALFGIGGYLLWLVRVVQGS